ncbi:MAG: M16 family metallopeptidase [Verrucomicrobiales bacterium]
MMIRSFATRAVAVAVGAWLMTGCDRPRPSTTGEAPGAVAASGLKESTRWAHVGSDLKPDAQAEFGALANGMRFILLPNAEPPGRVSLRLFIEAGSLHESEEQRGLAHFLEHMAFNGTKNFPAGQMVEYFQRLGMAFGADTNAHTSFRETVYKLELPPGPDGQRPEAGTLRDGLELLRDVGDGMLIDGGEVEKERGIILSEKLARDTTQSRIMEEGLKFQLPDHRISNRLPIGLEAVISEAPAERLVDFYRRFYTPDRMVLVAVGAIEAATLRGQIVETFGSMAPGTPAPDPRFGSLAEGRGITTKVHLEKETGHATISFVVARTAVPTPDSAASRRAELVRDLAARMVTRRLDVLSKEEGSPILQGQVALGPFLRLIEMAELEVMAPPPRWNDAVALGARELKRAMTHGFSRSELTAARAELLAELENEAKSVSTRKSRDLADEVVRTLGLEKVLTHPEVELPRVREALASVTAEECHQAFQKGFGSNDLSVFAAGNLPPSPTGETLEAALQRGMSEKAEAPREEADLAFAYADFGPPGAVTTRTEVSDLGVTQLVFANGARASLKPTDFKKDEILIQVSFGTGKLSIPADQPGLEFYTQRVFELGGLGRHSVDDLKRILAGRTASVTFAVGEDAFALAGSTTRDDLDVQLQLLCAYLSDPGWRPEADRLFRQTAGALFAQVAHALEAQPQVQIEPWLRGSDHRFAFPSQEEALARTLGEAKAWLAPALTRGSLDIGIVGDFDPAAAEKLIAATFGALTGPREDPKQSIKPLAFPDPGRQIMRFQSKIEKGLVAAHFPTTDRSDIQTARRLQILAAIFSDQLRERIREELGESYSPRASAAFSDVFPGYGYIFANVLVAPSQAEKVSTAIREIATSLQENGASEDDLERARKPLLAAIEDQRRTNTYWLNMVVATGQRDPRRLDWARTLSTDFQAVTAPEVASLARLYLSPSALREVHVLPTP